MGKKRRYRNNPQKFGKKYALKYGFSKDIEQGREIVAETTLKAEPIVLAAPEPVTEPVTEPVIESVAEPVVKMASVVEVSKEDPVVKAVKKTTTRRKTIRKPRKATEVSATTPKKTRRKRTTRSKTAS